MDEWDLVFCAAVLANIGYAYIVTKRRLRRKRRRSCWSQQWLRDRDNPAKKTMINLYSDWYQVCCRIKCSVHASHNNVLGYAIDKKTSQPNTQ